MTAKRKYAHDYLYQRAGSKHWYVKLRSPDGWVEKSLRTPDFAEAKIAASPMIAEHQAKLLAARPRLELAWRHEYEPNREHVAADGRRLLATDRELFYLDSDGRVTARVTNGEPEWRIMNLERRLGIPYAPVEITEAKRPVLARPNNDDAIIETYIRHANVTGYYEREARSVWVLYKTLTDNKPLAEATHDDGRKLVAHFESQGIKSATIKKKLGWLTAAVNLAIKEDRLTRNPFSGVVPKRDDSEQRLPLSDVDVRKVKRNLARLDDSDQVLLRLLACTGMRLSEAFEINSDATERGCRYVIVGTKTEQSQRRVPLPAGVQPYLPKAIKARLFKGDARAASKRLNRFLDDIGIADPRKVVHSLRHRAQDRLRAAGCPEDVRWAILGHEEKTVAAGYGVGFPVPLLKRWIDRIGF